MLYVSIGFEDFGNKLLHKHLTKNEKDIHTHWKPILEYVRNELGVYPHHKKIAKSNKFFNRQEKNFDRACNYIKEHMQTSGALLAHIHPDFMPAFSAEFYSVIDSDEERYGNFFLNTINKDKFNNNISNKNTFKFSRHNAIDTDDSNFVTDVATTIKESNGLTESIEEIEETILDKPTHYALYFLKNKVTELVSVDFALNYFVQDRIKKQKKMLEYTGINLIDIDQGLPSRFNINWEQFRKEYECQAGQSFNN